MIYGERFLDFASGFARNDKTAMNERYIKWYTPYLSREFEMLAFGDADGLPLILFPTSFGSYSEQRLRPGRRGRWICRFRTSHRLLSRCDGSGKLLQQIDSSGRSNANAQRLRKCHRARRVRSRPARMQLSAGGRERGESWCVSRGKHRVSSPGLGQPFL